MDRTTEMLSAYSCGVTYEELGPAVVEQVKRTLVDTMGCAIGGFDSEPAAIARAIAEGVSGGMPSRVLGTKGSTTPDLAAFANGVAVRYLDCNDSYFSPGGGHPSDMISAVLAVADPLRSDGPTVITGIALAYEVFCRLSDEVVASDYGWDQGIFSVIGAVCGAARVMGLTEEQTGNAISLAVTPHLPLAVTRTGELSMWKGCAAASASRSAVFAAQLASKGMAGPEEAFEGRRGLWEQAVGREVAVPDFPLGDARGEDDPFRITRTIFKAYPSQIHTQAPIGLALELREKVAGGQHQVGAYRHVPGGRQHGVERAGEVGPEDERDGRPQHSVAGGVGPAGRPGNSRQLCRRSNRQHGDTGRYVAHDVGGRARLHRPVSRRI